MKEEIDIEKERLKGTTTVGVVFRNGVVLAADRRATMGFFIASKDVRKIFKINDFMVMTMAGGVGDAQVLGRILRSEMEIYKYQKGEDVTVKAAATLTANILQSRKYYPYYVQLILGGYDETGPHLFDLDAFGGLLEHSMVATGSGSVTAYGYLDAHFTEKMEEKDACSLAAKAISAAMKRDAASGEGITLVVITEKGIRELDEKQVSAFSRD